MIVDKIIAEHNKGKEAFDLGSPHYINITIYKNVAIVSNTYNYKWAEMCMTSEVGSKIAETILLNGLGVPKCEYGDFLHNRDLPLYKETTNLKEKDFYMEESFVSFWTTARIICNRPYNLEDTKIYDIWVCENMTSAYEYETIEEYEKNTGWE